MTELSSTALDLIFEPRAGTPAHVPTNLLLGSGPAEDLSSRYMDVVQGGTATAATTNLQSNGADIATIFAKLGTVIIPDILWGGLGTISLSDTNGFIAGTTLTLKADGTATTQGTGTAVGDWLSPTGAGKGSAFETIQSAASGDTISGPIFWTSLDTDRAYGLTNGISGTTKTGTITVTIREKANISNLESRKLTLTAIVT